MKKLVLLFAAATLAVSASAQTVSESKTFDNIYIGINGGVATKTTGHKWLSDLNPNAGLRIGRYFTPVFGMAIRGNAYFSNKPWASTGTVVRAINTQLLGTVNLSNWFGGYKGEPRVFEVSALYGLGWGHVFNNKKNMEPINRMTSKLLLTSHSTLVLQKSGSSTSSHQSTSHSLVRAVTAQRLMVNHLLQVLSMVSRQLQTVISLLTTSITQWFS